jgi:hypothetical protein
MDVDHAIDQSGRHRFDDGAILRAIAGADNDGALWKKVLADPPLMNQAVKGFLDFVRAGVQLIEKEAIWRRPGDRNGWTKSTAAVDDLRHSDEVFGRKLTAEQRHAGQSDFVGEPLHQCGFPDAGRPPDENRACHRNVQQEVAKLPLSKSNGSVHSLTCPIFVDHTAHGITDAAANQFVQERWRQAKSIRCLAKEGREGQEIGQSNRLLFLVKNRVARGRGFYADSLACADLLGEKVARRRTTSFYDIPRACPNARLSRRLCLLIELTQAHPTAGRYNRRHDKPRTRQAFSPDTWPH